MSDDEQRVRPPWAERLGQRRSAHGWTQQQLASRLAGAAAEMGQGIRLPARESVVRELRDHECGKHKPGTLYHELYSRVYGVDAAELLAPASVPTSPALVGGPLVDLLALAWVVGRLDQRVDRRTVLQLAASVTGGAVAFGLTEPTERLGRALTGTQRIDPHAVEHLEARTNGFHWLEGHLPARDVYRGVMTHLNEISTLLESGPPEHLRHRLAVTAGESAVLAVWLAWELGDQTQVAGLSRLAGVAATQGDDPAIRACTLGYGSYMTVGEHRHLKARAMLVEAVDALPDGEENATRAWLLGRQAEESAIIGDASAAHALTARASDLFAATDMRARPWTRFLDRTRFGSMALSVYSRLGDVERAEQSAREVAASAAGLGEHKKLAVVGAEVALAYVRLGDVASGVQQARTSLAVTRALNAPLGWGRLDEVSKALSRSRVSAARAFREEYAATPRLPPLAASSRS